MAYFFIFAAVMLRLLPHMPNFTPIAAIALFGGVYLTKKDALIIPITALFISDLIIGFYNPVVMISVYGSFLLIGMIGLYLKKHKKIPYIIGGAVSGSILFFIITNFAMWQVPHSLYPHTLQGLINCYTMAIPFFRNTLLGDIFYVSIMFTLMEMVLRYKKSNVLKEVYAYFEGDRRKRF